jgi:hypothetical protein
MDDGKPEKVIFNIYSPYCERRQFNLTTFSIYQNKNATSILSKRTIKKSECFSLFRDWQAVFPTNWISYSKSMDNISECHSSKSSSSNRRLRTWFGQMKQSNQVTFRSSSVGGNAAEMLKHSETPIREEFSREIRTLKRIGFNDELVIVATGKTCSSEGSIPTERVFLCDSRFT